MATWPPLTDAQREELARLPGYDHQEGFGNPPETLGAGRSASRALARREVHTRNEERHREQEAAARKAEQGSVTPIRCPNGA